MQPAVSVIVPCYNEQATIGSLLAAVYAQTYPRERLEVVIADGFSEDGTRAEVADFQKQHPDLRIRLVDNVKRTIPSALNEAIRQSAGEMLVRLDAHSVPIPQYVEQCVRDLEAGAGASVGGVWTIVPGGQGWVAKGIAAAAAHPIGAGDAQYRLGGTAGPVDTVPFGAFRRDLFDKVGAFDETLLTNEDYEFNVRVRKGGGVIWLDPQIKSTYVARPSLGQLARQYWRYGYWKYRMLRRYPESLRWRQALPPFFVLALIGMIIATLMWRPAAWLLALAMGAYLLVLTLVGVSIAWSKRSALVGLGGALALATMHFAWGAGFLYSVVSGRSRRNG